MASTDQDVAGLVLPSANTRSRIDFIWLSYAQHREFPLSGIESSNSVVQFVEDSRSCLGVESDTLGALGTYKGA